jgi:diguanylate cyclase (GGDEF)-like protein
MPIASYVFHQSENYKAACDALAVSHAALAEAHDKLVYSTTHDPATGLLNREAFIGHLTRSRMEGECDTLLLVDADNFTRINDQYGHAQGDDILNRIAKALLYTTRRGDVVGRTGGTEFGIILRECHQDTALLRAETVRRHVETMPLIKSRRGKGRVTVSIGGAEICRGGNLSDLLCQAARCLYDAKQRGRNQVSFSFKEVDAIASKWQG